LLGPGDFVEIGVSFIDPSASQQPVFAIIEFCNASRHAWTKRMKKPSVLLISSAASAMCKFDAIIMYPFYAY
jgi:hypothetical protein